MEVIRIPQVSLVDATGRRIGVYTDDPDWWQQLKLKHHNTKMSHAVTGGPQAHAITSGASSSGGATTATTTVAGTPIELQLSPSRQMTPINNINSDSTTNLRSRLIRNDVGGDAADEEVIDAERAIQTGLTPAAQILPAEDHQKQCNVIGETPLHIAIMYDDLHTIQFLIEEKGFDVNQRSCGGRFIGGFNSKLTNSMIQQSKYEGLAYYGEYPLAFAACFASKEIYDYLVEKGADPNLQDTNGNTVLHVLVINNKIDMFQYATNHQKRKAMLTIKNNQDLTPINLAAKLGRKDLFEKMLELRNIEFWRYSNITCSAYPLEGLDTVDPDGKIAWNAALSYIVNGKTEDHLDMLEIGVVKRLLEDKWSTYAQKRFFSKLIISIIHLIFLSIAVYTRAADSGNLDQWPPGSANTWVRYISELAVLIGCLAILFLAAQEIYAQGFLYYLKNLGGEPANVFYIIFCIFILIAVPFRFAKFDDSETHITNRNVEDTFVILAIPCGWVHLLFYARVATVTGPFVVMIYKMVIGDILTFSSIYSLLLFGFSSAFYYLYKNAGSSVTAMANYPEALMLSFQMTLGEFKSRLVEFDENYYSDFTKVVFVAFMILMHILLLNMLIAMMGNTYHQIIKKSEKEWRRQWAQVVILLERSFSPQDLKNYQLKYCIKLPSKDSNNKNELGLMVIKKAPKTKAFQKTACIRNWKKFCKEVMRILQEDNLKSHELLDEWANKDAKSTKLHHKKSKKSIDWHNFGAKALLNVKGGAGAKTTSDKNQQQRPITSARFSQKNNVRSINTNNKFEQQTARENSTVKKPFSTMAVNEQAPKKKDQSPSRQKDSVNSISSSVTSGSATNTITTTSSEASSSRSNSAGGGARTAQTLMATTLVLEANKKNSKNSLEMTKRSLNNTSQSNLAKNSEPSAPPPPPATTINPPSKDDYNMLKKSSYRGNTNASTSLTNTDVKPPEPQTQSQPSTNNPEPQPQPQTQPTVITTLSKSNPSSSTSSSSSNNNNNNNNEKVKKTEQTNTNTASPSNQQQPQTSVISVVPGVARPIPVNDDKSKSKAPENVSNSNQAANNSSTNNDKHIIAAVKPVTKPNDSNQIRTEPVQSTVDESKKPKPSSNEQSQSKPKVEKKELFATKQPTNDDLQNDIDLKPLITPQSSSNQSTDTTTSPVQSAHYSQPLDFQRIQLNRYIHKKTFYPNQTSKIYPSPGAASSMDGGGGRGLFSPDYYDHFPKQFSISPVHGDYPKMDLSDIVRRPISSSQPGSADSHYMKREEFPKFQQANAPPAHQQPRELGLRQSDSKSPENENLSLDDGASSSLFKDDEQNESKI